MIGLIVYIVMVLLTFFVASFAVAHWSWCDDPTDPDTFLLLVGVSLVWPVAILLIMVILPLFGIAMLAKKLSGGAR